MSASPAGIVPDCANGKDTRAEGSKIVGSVGAAAGSEMRFTMTENQDGRFARDSGDLAKLVFIGDKIAKENDRLRGELVDVVRKRQKIDRRGRIVLFCRALHFVGLRIQ